MSKGSFVVHNRADISLSSSPGIRDKVWLDPATGVIYNYDDSRDKWLSASTDVFEFARKNPTSNMYLPLLGDLDNADDVFTFRRGAAIVGITCKSKGGNSSKSFEIRLNGSVLHAFTYVNREYIKHDLDLDVSAGDELQLFVGADQHVNNTVCRIEFSWRYDK
jgi:hypothetical protein